MAMPGMDLQEQYANTLENTIGKSQQQRLRDLRRGSLDGQTQWDQRGVGAGAKRYAGFNEVAPSNVPEMSQDTRNFLNPVLGTYTEGGKTREGYYGSDNPYTTGGLESILFKQGYANAPTSLSDQFKTAGLKLPNAYGKEYYNAQLESMGNQLSPYSAAGFIPGKDNKDWLWADSNNEMVKALYGRELPTTLNGTSLGGDQNDIPVSGWGDILGTNTGGDAKFADGAGRWINPNVPNYNLGWTKDKGYENIEAKMKNMPMGKIIKPIVFAGMSLANPAFGAFASTMSSGLNGGDWGKALLQGAASYAGGSLAGAYGGDLAGAFGGTSDLAKGIASGAIRTGVNTIGNSLAGNGFDLRGSLANLAGGAVGAGVGDLVGDSVGGNLGTFLRNASSGTVGSLLSNAIKGNNSSDMARQALISGSMAGLGNLFAPQQQESNNPQITSQSSKPLNTLFRKT